MAQKKDKSKMGIIAGIGIAAAGIGIYFATRAHAQPAIPSNLTGKVTDAGTSQPIAGATVTLGSHTATTDASGDYAITNLTAGPYTITIAAEGYVGGSHQITLVEGDNVQDVALPAYTEGRIPIDIEWN